MMTNDDNMFDASEEYKNEDEVEEADFIDKYFGGCGSDSEISLSFQGDINLAKSYLEQDDNNCLRNAASLEKASASSDKRKLNSNSYEISNKQNSSSDDDNMSNNSASRTSTRLIPKNPCSFSDLSTTTLYQYTGESRMQYLLRFPKLLQIAVNSSDFEMMKKLYNEVLTDDCIFQGGIYGLSSGRQKILEISASTVGIMPDYYAIAFNIKRVKKRMITHSLFTTGTQHRNSNIY